MMVHFLGRRVRIEGDAGYREIWLSRPEARNAIDTVMRDELLVSLDTIARDDSIRRIGILADGPDFCAGGDMAEFGTATDVVVASNIRLMRSLPQLMLRIRDKLIVGIQGSAVGAGIELASFARVVVAGLNSRFKLPELAMGLIPGAGGTVSITQRIGPARTLQMLLEGTWMPASEALAIGLVDELVDEQLLSKRIRQIALT